MVEKVQCHLLCTNQIISMTQSKRFFFMTFQTKIMIIIIGEDQYQTMVLIENHLNDTAAATATATTTTPSRQAGRQQQRR